MTNVRLSQTRSFEDDNYKSGENTSKFSKWVKNTLGKGGIACNEPFLLSHSVFKRLLLQTCKIKGLYNIFLALYGNIVANEEIYS